MLFTCIKSWFFRNHLPNFHQISHWSFCWNVIDSLFKWSCSIDCQAHIFFFKTKNCSNDDIFISCDDRIGKMLHNICMSAVAMSLRWANRGQWASCFYTKTQFVGSQPWWLSCMRVRLVIRRLQVRTPPVWQHSFMEIDHEIISMVILSLPLIQEFSGERMCTILLTA